MEQGSGTQGRSFSEVGTQSGVRVMGSTFGNLITPNWLRPPANFVPFDFAVPTGDAPFADIRTRSDLIKYRMPSLMLLSLEGDMSSNVAYRAVAGPALAATMLRGQRLVYTTDEGTRVSGAPFRWDYDTERVDGKTSAYMNYAYFPGVSWDSQRNQNNVQPFAVFYANFRPMDTVVGHPAKWISTRVTSNGSSMYIDMSMIRDGNAAFSILSGLNISRPEPNTYVWFSRMVDNEYHEYPTQLYGASMGLALIAAVCGGQSIMYTGFVKKLDGLWYDKRTKTDVEVPRTDDTVEEIKELPWKMMWCVMNDFPMVIPHKGSYGQDLRGSLEKQKEQFPWAYLPMTYSTVQADQGLAFADAKTPILLATSVPEALSLSVIAATAYILYPAPTRPGASYVTMDETQKAQLQLRAKLRDEANWDRRISKAEESNALRKNKALADRIYTRRMDNRDARVARGVAKTNSMLEHKKDRAMVMNERTAKKLNIPEDKYPIKKDKKKKAKELPKPTGRKMIALARSQSRAREPESIDITRESSMSPAPRARSEAPMFDEPIVNVREESKRTRPESVATEIVQTPVITRTRLGPNDLIDAARMFVSRNMGDVPNGFIAIGMEKALYSDLRRLGDSGMTPSDALDELKTKYLLDDNVIDKFMKENAAVLRADQDLKDYVESGAPGDVWRNAIDAMERALRTDQLQSSETVQSAGSFFGTARKKPAGKFGAASLLGREIRW